ncbi:hypothetical protein CKO25_18090 [Thiocapsa imhoffii]|uniref:Uncharacterized protein n=1 Tax=Thiocapsa imhoffii TaxID=382777 RepID=A0A9X1BA16_9GAMM|nr:hypothetical protein [Thiocapsa imhoffii]
MIGTDRIDAVGVLEFSGDDRTASGSMGSYPSTQRPDGHCKPRPMIIHMALKNARISLDFDAPVGSLLSGADRFAAITQVWVLRNGDHGSYVKRITR